MGDATGKDASSGTLSKPDPKGGTERRRYDLTGSIPQWITSALLAIIGVLILMVWNSMDRRVNELEKKIETIVAAQESKTLAAATDIAAIKVHNSVTDQIVAELRVGQMQTSTLVTQVVTELKFLSAQLAAKNGQK